MTPCDILSRKMLKTKVIQTRLVPEGDILAITLFGLVLTRHKELVDKYVLNHELIHCHQQLEWLYLPFFVLYGLEWLLNILRQKLTRGKISFDRAYREISFEREAYAHDHDLGYLRRRRLYANYGCRRHRARR